MNFKNKSCNPYSGNIRGIYSIAIVITILLGLASRKYSPILPLFVTQNIGDMFWAMMVYFGFRFLLVRERLFTAFWLSFLFSFGVEFSQLYQDDWINKVRNTTLGALILGKGFLTMDLVRYTAGIMIAIVLDKGLLMFMLRKSTVSSS